MWGNRSRQKEKIQSVSTTLQELKREIQNLSCEELQTEMEYDQNLLLVDIREIQEWVDLGTIAGSQHVPRGMLEFWADPHGPYFRNYFDSDRRTVLFCAAGGRSALAVKTLKEMGYSNVAHLDPGFNGWKKEGREVESTKQKTRWIRRRLFSQGSEDPEE